MADKSFSRCDMSGATFRSVNLGGADFDDVNLAGARINNANFAGSRIHDANLADVAIDGCYVKGMTIDGVLVEPLIAAELDRRDPERRRLRMSDRHDPACVRSVLSHLATLRAVFCEQIRGASLEMLTRRPDPEHWSAVEHARHLIFVEDMYLNRWILGNSAPRPKIGLLPSFLAGNPDYAVVGSEPSTDVEMLLATWGETCERILELAARLGVDDLRREIEIADARPGTVGNALQIVAQHERDHMLQAVAAIASAPVGVGG
jgi:hypothetical protein